jgi:hypothetical protein
VWLYHNIVFLPISMVNYFYPVFLSHFKGMGKKIALAEHLEFLILCRTNY